MLFYNEDWIHFLMTRYAAGICVDEQYIKDFIYEFKGTQVTDFVMNLNGTVSTSPSEILDTFAKKYTVTEENGVKVDYRDTFAALAYGIYEKQGLDIHKIWIDALKEIGINPWISIRMNDSHGNGGVPELRKGAHVEKYSEYWISAHREASHNFDMAFDYSYPWVRELMLSYIDEQLSRYDVYGLELDFMRDLKYFSCGKRALGREIMKRFIESVFEIKAKHEVRYGHKIKLSLIFPPSPNLVIEEGIDIQDFLDKLDTVVIIGRWNTTDTDMPIELWRQILARSSVKLACGQQLLFAPCFGKPRVTSSVAMAFGQAIANLSRGADAVYLYNYMDMGEYELPIDWIYESSIKNGENRSLILNNIGKSETLLTQKRSHAVSYCDSQNYYGAEYSRLPIFFDGNGKYELVKIPVGELAQGAVATLLLGINSEELSSEDFEIFVNSKRAEYLGRRRIEPKIYPRECYLFPINNEISPIAYAEIRINKKCTVEYVEIEIAP